MRCEDACMKATEYLSESVEYGGETMRRGDVIADLQRQGVPQSYIERYLQGLDAQRKVPA